MSLYRSHWFSRPALKPLGHFITVLLYQIGSIISNNVILAEESSYSIAQLFSCALVLPYVLMVAIYVVLSCTVDMNLKFQLFITIRTSLFSTYQRYNSGANNRNNDNFHKAV